MRRRTEKFFNEDINDNHLSHFTFHNDNKNDNDNDNDNMTKKNALFFTSSPPFLLPPSLPGPPKERVKREEREEKEEKEEKDSQDSKDSEKRSKRRKSFLPGEWHQVLHTPYSILHTP